MQFSDKELSLSETRRRLREWGNWHNAILLSGLSYARKSIIGQLMDSKGVLIGGTNKFDMPDNPNAEQAGQLVHALKHSNLKWTAVIKYHYTNDLKFADKAKALNLPVRTYQYYLLKAEKWIDKRLSEEKK